MTTNRAWHLTDWAHFPKGAEGAAHQVSGFSVTTQNLRALVLEEPWEFGGNQDANRPSPILRNYLRWTFSRLWREKKVEIRGDYAAFNTGLVDHRYEPIYAVFGKNKLNPGRQPWYFVDFCIAGEDQIGKTLVRFFNPLPLAAHYFGDPRSMFYDLNAGEPMVDWEHVIVENVDRLPEQLLQENCPEGFRIESVAQMNSQERQEYVSRFRDAIRKDSQAYRSMKNRFKDAVELALKRVRWNFKTSIPQYFPTRDEMSLLLPLDIVSDEQPDLALVVERTQSGNYLGHTVLPLDWAYNNARLICRPLSDWLIPERIKETTLQGSEEGSETDSDAQAVE